MAEAPRRGRTSRPATLLACVALSLALQPGRCAAGPPEARAAHPAATDVQRGGAGHERRAAREALQRAIDDFEAVDLSGRQVSARGLRGRVVILDFWATWCAPCREEIPGLVELYERYGDAGFVVLGVAVDDEDDAVEAYVEELGITYPVLLENGRYELRDAYGPLVGFPTSFLITREGTICVRHVGIASKERHEAEIEALL